MYVILACTYNLLFSIIVSAHVRSIDIVDGEHSLCGVQRDSSSDADSYRQSGTGILQFSTEKAGRDVTPANFYAGPVEHESCSAFSSVAGEREL